MTEASIHKKNRIADCFEQHFRHFGFSKTRVDEVAEELGASKKTIYKYFRSKDDIFSYVISRKASYRREMIEKKIRHLDTAWEKMETMIRINFSEFRKVHKSNSRDFGENAQSGIAAGIFRKTFLSLLNDILDEGIEKNEFEVCDMEMSVRYIQAIIVESLIKIREDGQAKPEELLICTIKKLIGRRSK